MYAFSRCDDPSSSLIEDFAVDKSKLEAMSARLDRMEVECRRWRRGAIAGAVLGVVGLLIGASSREDPKTVDAERFLLRDKAGEIRAAWAVQEDGSPIFELFDEQGRSAVAFGYHKGLGDRPSLVFYNGEQADLAVGYGDEDSVGLNIYDKNGIRTSVSVMQKSGNAGAFVYDRRGKLRSSVAVSSDDTPSVGLSDGEATLRAAIALSLDGRPFLNIYDKKGQNRIALAELQEDSFGLSIIDADDVTRIGLGSVAGGVPGLTIFDQNGAPEVSVP
jgi:hypothetical protein